MNTLTFWKLFCNIPLSSFQKTFPNTFFGIVGHKVKKEVAEKLDLEWMLLETDSPHLPPKAVIEGYLTFTHT